MKILHFDSDYISNNKSIKNFIEEIDSIFRFKSYSIIIIFSNFNLSNISIKNIYKFLLNKNDIYIYTINNLEKYYINVIEKFIPVIYQSIVIAQIKIILNKVLDIANIIYSLEEINKSLFDKIRQNINHIDVLLIHYILLHKKIHNEYLNILSNKIYKKDLIIDFIRKTSKKKIYIIPGISEFDYNNNNNILSLQDKANYKLSKLICKYIDISSINFYKKYYVNFIKISNDNNDIININHNIHNSIINNVFIDINYLSLCNDLNKYRIPFQIHNKFFKQIIKINGNIESNENFDSLFIERIVSFIKFKINGSYQEIKKYVYDIDEKYNINIYKSLYDENYYYIQSNPKNSRLIFNFLKKLNIKYISDISIIKNTEFLFVVKNFNKLNKNDFIAFCKKMKIKINDIIQNTIDNNVSILLPNNIDYNTIDKIKRFLHRRIDNYYTKKIAIYIVGIGLIGSKLIDLLKLNKNNLYSRDNIQLNLVGITNSKNMIISNNNCLIDNFEQKSDIISLLNDTKLNINTFIESMISNKEKFSNSIFIDCTSDANIIHNYKHILDNKISIVTPNKNGNSSLYSIYKQIHETVHKLNNKASFLYETTVGAGLPIISTLKALIKVNDPIIKIEAVLSGTISYIINILSNKIKFSEAVKIAHEKGYSEPNPKDDLTGLDVARKILILAREIGMEIELSDIDLQPLITEECIKSSGLENFFHCLKKMDDFYHKKYTQAINNNLKLRYIAVLEKNKVYVKLTYVNNDHPFFNLSGSDNIILFKTQTYNNNPIIIRGPGAGADVTSLGILSDILQISNK
ncbi:MAG: hypothetical protein IR527_01040 [Bacteroides sp.]|nr:MAG: hypothetical protein IR527_01040 [Bacteroides sp.]